jgi:prolipoprotein diacylglyceryl transferase
VLPFSLPSPAQGIWYLGPLPLRAYALCIIIGIIAAIWLAERRWVSRGGEPGAVSDVSLWAIPFGIVGGRLYHVVTDPQLYFADGQNPWSAFAVWRGGLGIWGAIALGAVGAWIGARRAGISFSELAWALAPAIPLAQAIGRWGNWFNQELFGRPTDLMWGIRIDPEHRPAGYETQTTFHPTFLYESMWNLGLAGLLIWAGGRFRMTGGQLFAVYVMGYTAGRSWIEYLRIDTVNHVLGVRLNVWTSIAVFLAAAVAFSIATRRARAVEARASADELTP